LAITLDTSIFFVNGYRFEHGLLARLKQFNHTPVDVVLSDVVCGEVKAHVIRDATEAQSKVRTGIKEVSKAWQVSQAQRDAAISALFGVESPEQLAQRRISGFIEYASIEMVESGERASVAAVLAAYFAATPPFGKLATKKSEFPDAFALHALEHWANEKNLLMLVVSKDGDWQRYCKGSRHLVSSDDLAKALSYFHQNAEVACGRLVARFNAGQLPIEGAIQDAVRDATERMTFTPTVSSGYFYDADVYDIDVTAITIHVDIESPSPFKVIDKPEENVLVVEADVEATIAVSSSFYFSITDPIDKDEVPIGSASTTVDILVNVKVLLTFEGDLSEDARLVEVEVELGAQSVEVDYGDVGPNWDEDPDPCNH
jgi:hypothetical protein